MQRIGSIGAALVLVLACNSAHTQSATPSEVEQLKSLVSAQQKLLDHQQAEIEALQKAIAEQKEMLTNALKGTAGGATQAAPSPRVAENRPSAGESQHLSPEQVQV